MATEIQKISAELPVGKDRVETGPLQINDDWCGTFIRGDNSLCYALALDEALEKLDKENNFGDPLQILQIRRLRDILAASDERTHEKEE